MDDTVLGAGLPLDRYADVFKALGHPARLAMVCELFEGEQCVCRLRDLVGLDTSTVSRHLSVLRQAGVVRSRKQGNWAYYALELECVKHFVQCLSHRGEGKE
ncbi:ArsR/SmtB family transcription factor [Salidesulfovibrio brasiliensis]|uniref:ArsR/SmtB family transcription factor n=1 Tax=Salidesulfovibrio brasiliensis TaxID=221711 RepID=UPI0006D07E18|nr:metalloregulator ArsR/SmtB family transcription factor [Salidesulfovibrio brasiliensis]